MDILTGLALLGSGAAIGSMLMAEFYSNVKKVQDQERKRSECLANQLDTKTRMLLDMEKKRAQEASWCDGYEAGMREGMRNAMQGIEIGDVITYTRIQNARRINGTKG